MGCSNDSLEDNKYSNIPHIHNNIRTAPTRVPMLQQLEPYLQSNNDQNFNFHKKNYTMENWYYKIHFFI